MRYAVLMAIFRDRAVVLRTHKLGEADRIITLLTQQHGLRRAVARGVRKTASRFGGRLEPFSLIDVQCYEGRSLDNVTQVETGKLYGVTLSQDYEAYMAASAICETAVQLTENEQHHSPAHFRLVAGALGALAAHQAPPPLLLASYLLRALAVAGWAAQFHTCVECGTEILSAAAPAAGVATDAAAAAPAAPAAGAAAAAGVAADVATAVPAGGGAAGAVFSFELGGVLCTACALGEPQLQQHPLVAPTAPQAEAHPAATGLGDAPFMSVAALQLLQALQQGAWEQARAAAPAVQRSVSQTVEKYAQWHLERRLRSLLG